MRPRTFPLWFGFPTSLFEKPLLAAPLPAWCWCRGSCGSQTGWGLQISCSCSCHGPWANDPGAWTEWWRNQLPAMPASLPGNRSKDKHSEIISALETKNIVLSLSYHWISRDICSEGEPCLSASPSNVGFEQRAKKIWGEFPFEPWPPILSSLWILIHNTHVNVTLLSSQGWAQIPSSKSSHNFGLLQAESVCSCQSSPAAPGAGIRALTQSLFCKLMWTVFNCACRACLISVIITPAPGASKTPKTNHEGKNSGILPRTKQWIWTPFNSNLLYR